MPHSLPESFMAAARAHLHRPQQRSGCEQLSRSARGLCTGTNVGGWHPSLCTYMIWPISVRSRRETYHRMAVTRALRFRIEGHPPLIRIMLPNKRHSG